MNHNRILPVWFLHKWQEVNHEDTKARRKKVEKLSVLVSWWFLSDLNLV